MKLIREDVTSALAKAIEIAFKPALIGSLVTYTISGRLLEVPITWELLEILRVIAFNSICVSILVTLLVAVLVLMVRFMLKKARSDLPKRGESERL
jgi:hypothetical protein